MAMKPGEKKALWIAAAIGVIVLIWLLWARRQGAAGAPISTGPSYLTYNFPDNTPWVGSATGLPTIPSSTPDNACGCGGGNNGFFSSIQQMLGTFMQGATNAFNSYQNNVYSSYPDYVTQYFNNPVGAGLAQASQSTLEVSGQQSATYMTPILRG